MLRSLSLVAAICSLTIGLSSAQPITMGMKPADLSKSYPAYAKQFTSSKSTITIHGFTLHGMKGTALFRFDYGMLVFFNWEFDNSISPLAPEVATRYSILVKGLQSDWGPGTPKASSYNSRVQTCTWNLPHATGYVQYSPVTIKVQLVDRDFLARKRGGKGMRKQPNSPQ